MSVRTNRLVFVCLLVLLAALMFALNSATPLMMDDYDYSFSWSTGERLTGIADIISSQKAHYMLWGGRSVTHFLTQLFLYWGKPVFNLANSLMYVLLLIEIYALSKRRDTVWDWRMVLVAHMLLFTAVEFFGVAFLWLDGACNYLWGTALALIPLLICRSERDGGFFDHDGLRGFLSVPLCFFAGWTNENTACGVLAALVLLMAWDGIQKRRVRMWRVVSVSAQAMGVALMLLAPGNFARAGEEAARGFALEMIYRAAVVCYCLLRYAGVPMLLAATVLFSARRMHKILDKQWICVILGSAVLSVGALIGSPQISDRSFTAVIVLMICVLLTVVADCRLPFERRILQAGTAAVLICAALGVYAFVQVDAHGRIWQRQLSVIEQAVQVGEKEVSVSSVASVSRYTMDIRLNDDPQQWPNSTLSKYYGIDIIGR